CLLQSADQKDVRIRAARRGHALAFEVSDRLYARIRTRDERRPLRPGVDIDRLDWIAVDLANKCRRTCGGTKVERACVEKLERLVGSERLYPLDLDAVLLELLFEKTLVFERDRDRIVGRPVDPNFTDFILCSRKR